MARSFRAVWERIARDAGAVVHIGLNCSALTPPELPLVYECVDSTLTQLDSRHYRLAATRPCIVHCQTDRIRDALERTMAARTPRWTTVTSPCYFASYTDAPAAQDPRLIAFVGRLAAEKNPVLFVDAIALLRDRGVACRALILGHGPLREAVQRRVAELSLGGLVEIEFTERPIERLRQASIYVTLQSGDNYGSQSLLEAMGAGCAIVASDVGETWKLVRDDTGVRVPFDARALAGALEALLGNSARTRMLGAAAANLARIHHSADRYVMFLEQLYQQAVEVSQHGRVFDGRYSQWRMIN